MKNTMLKIDQNRRKALRITLFDGDTAYKLAEGEKIILGIKKDLSKADEYLISKVITSANKDGDDYVISLTTAETNVSAGYYKYDIALLRSTGELETLVGADDCVIIGSVVRSGEW